LLLTENIINQIKNKVKPSTLLHHYNASLVNKSAGAWKCIFHDDGHASLVAKDDRDYWKCMAGCGQGDIFSLVEKKEGFDFKQALEFLAKFANIDYNFEKHENILQEKHLEYLRKRGIKRSTAWKYQLEANNDYIGFPQKRSGFKEGMKYLGIKKIPTKKKNQFFDGDDTKSKLFPDYNITGKILYIVAGEYDCMLLDQKLEEYLDPVDYSDYSVRTNSTGENSIPRDIIPKLKKCKNLEEIRIVYDFDKAGSEGAVKMATALSELDIPVNIVSLDDGKSEKPSGFDVTDFFQEGNTLFDFFELPKQLHKPSKMERKTDEGVLPPAMHLSIQNERLLLSYAVKNNGFIPDLIEKLAISDFLNRKYIDVLKFIVKNYEKLGKINTDTLDHHLGEQYKNIGGELEFGTDEGYEIQSPEEFEYCINAQKDYSYQNKFRRFMNQSFVLLKQNNHIITQELSEFISQNTDLLLQESDSKKVTNMSELKLKYINNKEVLRVMATRHHSLDQSLNGGLTFGKLVIVAGRPSTGKPTFCLQLAETYAKDDLNPCFYSLETDGEEAVHQILAREHQKNNKYFRYKSVDMETIKVYKHDEKFFFNDKLFTPEDIYNDIKIRVRKDGCKIFFIDHFQLLDMSKSKKKNRLDFFTHWSSKFQQLAKEENIVIILLSQLNRNIEGRSKVRPTLADLKETGSLEQDAHTILMLFSPEKENQQSSPMVNVMVAKCKNGTPGEINFLFDRAYSSFYELDYVPTDVRERFKSYIQPKF
jgi:replicative DNA helicase